MADPGVASGNEIIAPKPTSLPADKALKHGCGLSTVRASSLSKNKKGKRKKEKGKTNEKQPEPRAGTGSQAVDRCWAPLLKLRNPCRLAR